MRPLPQKILMVGAGTMGGQISLQCARYGFRTTVYDVSIESLLACQNRQVEWLDRLSREGNAIDAEAVIANMEWTADPEHAAADADLLIESVPESRRLKTDVFRQFGALCSEACVFTTNSSTLMPSTLAAATGRPDRFAAFHFHEPVWVANSVDVMQHEGTSPETIEWLVDFSRRIDQVPIRYGKESPGYVFNTMLQSYLRTALHLLVDGVATPEDIDRSWMATQQATSGPFGNLDRIGIDVIHDIMRYWSMALRDPRDQRIAELLKGMIDQGKLGVKTGSGFYQYPHPRYQDPDFLTSDR